VEGKFEHFFITGLSLSVYVAGAAQVSSSGLHGAGSLAVEGLAQEFRDTSWLVLGCGRCLMQGSLFLSCEVNLYLTICQ
jgi:hypothetical protein